MDLVLFLLLLLLTLVFTFGLLIEVVNALEEQIFFETGKSLWLVLWIVIAHS